jgi:DNA polymerase-3 subunit alpha (Gram-positive type)
LIRKGIASLPNVISTRDDIMLFLIQNGLEPLTSFKIMEDVRKGKGLKPEYEELMIKTGIPGWYIESCKKIKYMFPKAHAAAYVMMAFRIAWFKVYYPEAFYATYFTVRADEFDADIISRGRDRVRYAMEELEKKGNEATQKEKNMLTILEIANEMYARGINCLPVDLYASDAVKFNITDKGLLPPLTALQGLGSAAAANIVEARKKGRFISVEDLKIRAGISKSVIEILETHECLDGMQQSNQMCFF